MTIYKPISLNLVASTQFGTGRIAVAASNHLWSWKPYPGTADQNLDLQWAVNNQYGSDYRIIHKGVHKDDWKAFAPNLNNYYVLPVLQVASDYFFDIEGVKQALLNLNSLTASIREFYRLQVGKTFRLLEPICQYSELNSQQWYDLAQLSLYDSHRAEYGDKAIATLKDRFGQVMNPNLIYLVTQFCGFNPAKIANKISPYGAINRGNISVIPATACLEQRTTTDPNDFNSLFACGHELGHAFGLPHTDQNSVDKLTPGWGNSIMQWGWNGLDNANLLPCEIDKLKTSPFFF